MSSGTSGCPRYTRYGFCLGDGRPHSADARAKALISVYTDLLRFYLKTIVLFQESHFVLHVALDILKPAVADIVSSFNTHADTLSKLLEAENFASIQEIKDEQVETLSMLHVPCASLSSG